MKHIFDFRDPAVQALQFLECINSKDTNQKAQFFRNSLPEVFPIIPKVGECIYMMNIITSIISVRIHLFFLVEIMASKCLAVLRT